LGLERINASGPFLFIILLSETEPPNSTLRGRTGEAMKEKP
jgi:hypothetical protein